MGRGGTKTEKVEHGMERKWNRHFTGRFRICAYACAISGFTILILNTFIWSQFYYVTTFNSILTFELVVDEKDMIANDWTFKRFLHYKQDDDTRLTKWNFFGIKNPKEVLTENQKPVIEEIGPFAAVLDTVKYDVAFTQDDFQKVTYKEYTYYRETENPGACERMFYRMGLGTFVNTDPTSYCVTTECRCKDLDTSVTTFNHVFARLLHDYKPHGLVAILSREGFEANEYYLTRGPFMKAVKGHAVENLLRLTINYRKAVSISIALDQSIKTMQLLNGTDAPYESFIVNQDDVKYECGDVGFLDKGNPWGGCPIGIRTFITDTSETNGCLGTTTLSRAEAEIWFQRKNTYPFSPLNTTIGTPMWIAAGRYLKDQLDDMQLLEDSPIDDGTGGERAFNALVGEAVKMQNTSLSDATKNCHAKSKVMGIAHWMYSLWLQSSKLPALVAKEWGDQSTPRNLDCDVGSYYVAGNFRKKIDIIGEDLYLHGCNFPLHPWLTYFESEMGQGILSDELFNETLAQYIMNEDMAVTGANGVSILLDENRINYWAAYSYANMTLSGANINCGGYYDNLFRGVKTSVLALSDASSVGRVRGNISQDVHGIRVALENAKYKKFQAMASAIGAYLYEGWADGPYLEAYLLKWFNSEFHEGTRFTSENINDIGYAQFAGSYMTEYLFGVGLPSVRNVNYESWWAFAPPQYQAYFFPEFKPNAIVEGYPAMNMSFNHGKKIMTLLSSSAPEARAFREFLVYTHTTYHCDAPDFVEYMCENSLVNNEDLYCEAVKETFVPFYARTGSKCNPGDNYFIDQFVFANFSWNSPYNPIDIDSLKYEKISRRELEDLLDFLNEPMYSSVESCEKLDQMAYSCATEVSDAMSDGYPHSTLWSTRCDEYTTQMEDSAFGLYCTATSVGLAYDSHPFPMKRANVLAKMIQNMALNQVLRFNRFLCDNPVDCDYKKGGVYTTRTARQLLFDGYVDPIAVKVLNEELKSKNMSIECVNKSTIAKDEFCFPIANIECTDDGFRILYHGNMTNQTKKFAMDALVDNAVLNGTGENVTASMTVSRVGENVAQWYSTFLTLPDGTTIRNPTYAHYSGMLWNGYDFRTGQNDSLVYEKMPPKKSKFVEWQKRRNCGMAKFGGKPGKFKNCEITVNTGRLELNKINRYYQYHGNVSFFNTHEYGYSGGFNMSGTGFMQYEPFLFEGFTTFDGFFYWFRDYGLKRMYYPGKEIPVMVPEELMIFNMKYKGVQGVAWPPRTELFPSPNNVSTEFALRTIKYAFQNSDWLEAGARSGTAFKDLLGMKYTVPKGMSSIEYLTDMPLFLGSPHHHVNTMEGGFEYLQFIGLGGADSERYDEFESYIEIDPITGKLMRGAKRFQYSYRMEKNSLFPAVTGCNTPTESFSILGYGCIVYHPAFIIDESNVIDYAEASRLKYSYYILPLQIFYATIISGVLGGIMLCVPVRVIKRVNKAEIIFKQRVYID